jgi:hypothetical protein
MSGKARAARADDTPDIAPCRYCDAPVCARHCGICGDEGKRIDGYDFPVCAFHGPPAPGDEEDGALGWAFRPPAVVGRPGCDLEIQIGGVTRYQQRPPTHVKGSGYKSATVRVVRREIGEQHATRINAALDALTPAQRDVMRLKLAGHSHATIAGELGLALVTVDERVKRGKAAMRKGAR